MENNYHSRIERIGQNTGDDTRFLRLGIVLLAAVFLFFNALLWIEILLWQPAGEHPLFGRYPTDSLLSVFAPAIALGAFNIFILMRSSVIMGRVNGIRPSLLILAIIFLVSVAAMLALRMDNPRLALLFALAVILEGLAAVLFRMTPRAAVPFVLVTGLTLIPLLSMEAILYHRMMYIQALPDYSPPLVIELSKLPQNPGGLLLANMDCRARGSSLLTTIHWKTNSFGFRNEVETPRDKPPGQSRILVLGDSFSAGYHLSQNETLPSRLQQALAEKGHRVQVLNAQTEDPITAAWYLDHHGFSFNPDMVVLAFCIGNDLMECEYHLSFSRCYQWIGEPGASPLRLNPDRAGFRNPNFFKMKFPSRYLTGRRVTQPNLWSIKEEPLWQFSFGRVWLMQRALRLAGPGWVQGAILPACLNSDGFAHPMDITTGFGAFAKGPIREVKQSFSFTRDALRRIQNECARRGIPFVVVAIPQCFQIYPSDWRANCNAYGLRKDQFDMERPNRRLKQMCQELGIHWVDLLPPMRKQSKKPQAPRLYFRGGDMHWNKRGAELGARVAADQIAPLLSPNQAAKSQY